MPSGGAPARLRRARLRGGHASRRRRRHDRVRGRVRPCHNMSDRDTRCCASAPWASEPCAFFELDNGVSQLLASSA